jgi:hypothetical protein
MLCDFGAVVGDLSDPAPDPANETAIVYLLK